MVASLHYSVVPTPSAYCKIHQIIDESFGVVIRYQVKSVVKNWSAAQGIHDCFQLQPCLRQRPSVVPMRVFPL